MWYNRDMDKKAILFLVLGLALGDAIGYFAAPDPVSPPHHGETPHRRSARMADHDQSATLATLRNRVRELERRLAETAAQTPTNATPINEANPPPGPPNMMNFRARMEEMQKNNPEQYAQMTNRMAQWRARHIAQTQDRLDFLASLDPASMSPKELANHEKLQNLIVHREELMQMMRPDAEGVTDEQREKAHQEMRSTWQQLHDLEQAERDMLLRQTARNLGCKGPMVRELVDTIKTIYDATQSFGHGRGPGGPGRGGRGHPRN